MGKILRNGASIETVALKEVTDSEIFSMMAGKEQKEGAVILTNYASDSDDVTTNPLLKVENLIGKKEQDINFSIGKGEILGVAGLEGQGNQSYSSY